MKKIILSIFFSLGILSTSSFSASNAGIEQHVFSLNTVQLDGTESTLDRDGEELKYKWKQVKDSSTPTVDLSQRKTATPTFVAPNVNETTEFIFKLKTVELYDCKKKNHKGFKGSKGSKGSKSFKGKNHKKRKQCKQYKTYDFVSIFVSPSDNNTTENNETNTSSFHISGKIVDTNGTAISNASVNIDGQTVITDISGTYTVMNILATNRLLINVTHPDYFANSRIVDVNNTDVSLDITLNAPKAMLTFDSTLGTTISEASGASVQLPANGYVDVNGLPYTGSIIVRMAYHAITTQSGRDTFPGTFEGIDSNGSTFPIQSYGFMNVELTDIDGNPLNLDGNSVATLTFPNDDTINTPSTVPLWYYDETLGYWIQEGEATNIGHYSTFVGTVTHFTSWNLDAKGPRAEFTGCVEDENGTRIPNAQVQFRSINWDSYTRPTDANGSISVINILANTNLTFSAYAAIGSTYAYGEKSIYLTEGENRIDNSCVVVTPQYNLPGSITVTGTVMEATWTTDSNVTYTPVSNTSVNIYDNTSYPYNIVATGISANDGTFSITFTITDTIQYSVGTNYPYNSFILQENKILYDVGIIERIIQM